MESLGHGFKYSSDDSYWPVWNRTAPRYTHRDWATYVSPCGFLDPWRLDRISLLPNQWYIFSVHRATGKSPTGLGCEHYSYTNDGAAIMDPTRTIEASYWEYISNSGGVGYNQWNSWITTKSRGADGEDLSWTTTTEPAKNMHECRENVNVPRNTHKNTSKNATVSVRAPWIPKFLLSACYAGKASFYLTQNTW